MKLLIWVCLSQAIWPAALAIYHLKSMTMFKPPTALRNDSYFGYSITYNQQNHTLIISSPRENNIGEVYECNIEKLKCSKIPNPITRMSKTFTHDYWFGATVKAGPKYVVMCTPRYIGLYQIFNLMGTYGRCYSYSEGALTLLPGINANKRNDDSPEKFELSMDSFGWSLDVAFDDSIIVGGPGMFHGRAMIYPAGQTQPIFIQKKRFTPAFNFGYGVSSGTFINDKMSYAVSSTYGKLGVGEVHFFSGIERQNALASVDNEVGSMFGAVLCAAKLNGPRFDLLVGAPTYAKKSTYNTGAVYVYLSHVKKTGKPPVHKRTIKGKKEGGLFGSAIISLGDLNGDGRDEVAIGAPFENRGAVYLYSGAELISDKTEQTLQYLQKIEPAPGSAFGNSFGLSLTPLLDYDDNGCNEMAIGAPYSDAVFLLHCFASIKVTVTAHFPNLQTRALSGKAETNFKFDVCLNVIYPMKPKNVIARLSTTVKMNHLDAKLTKPDAKGTYTFETKLSKKFALEEKSCTAVDFTLPPDGNYDMEITYQLSSRLLDNPLGFDAFNPSRVVLSDHSVLTVQDSVSAAECSGKECVPKLEWNALSSFKDDYIIGSTESEWYEFSLHNIGEVAYDACVRVRFVGAHVLQPAPYCEVSTEADGLLCRPTKPLKTNSTWSTGHNILDMAALTNQNRNITVEVFIYNRCKDEKYTNNKTYATSLRADSKGVSVRGETKLGDVIVMSKAEIQSSGKNIEHVYRIINNGVSNWAGVTTVVTLQEKPFIKYNDNPVSVYIQNSDETDCPRSSLNEMKFTCKIPTVKAKGQQEIIKIVVPMNVVPGALDGILGSDKNVTIESYLSVFLEHGKVTEETSEKVISTIVREPGVPLWVILLATLVGLCILIIIAFILYECGFLRRKNKEELKKLQKSIRRQTIRRSAMQTQPEDRRQILERMVEENDVQNQTPVT